MYSIMYVLYKSLEINKIAKFQPENYIIHTETNILKQNNYRILMCKKKASIKE